MYELTKQGSKQHTNERTSHELTSPTLCFLGSLHETFIGELQNIGLDQVSACGKSKFQKFLAKECVMLKFYALKIAKYMYLGGKMCQRRLTRWGQVTSKAKFKHSN